MAMPAGSQRNVRRLGPQYLVLLALPLLWATTVVTAQAMARDHQPKLDRAASAQAGQVAAARSSAYTTPKPGSAERAAIMNAARIPVARALGQPVIFVVSVLRTDGRWAYLQAVPQRPDGQPLDWRTTPFAHEWARDAMSDVVMVLLRQERARWMAVDHVIGPTDVHWYNWLDDYGLPEALFDAEATHR